MQKQKHKLMQVLHFTAFQWSSLVTELWIHIRWRCDQ